jgi:DNA (cytosine-5)-methyltransferase 1
MPQVPPHGLRSLSLFSGGGGFDLGFDRAGYDHVASYDILEVTGATLPLNRPDWKVFAGPTMGDVRNVDWKQYRGQVDVLHGGPPCQPFSSAGKQLGAKDERDMFPEFVRAVLEARPRAFVAENVPALMQGKFAEYVQKVVVGPLSSEYSISYDILRVENFGVPEVRARVVFVGFRRKTDAKKFRMPTPTHYSPFSDMDTQRSLFDDPSRRLPHCMGVRAALGLPEIGYDGLAPTIRSGFTGPRFSTSVLNSVASQRAWAALKIWPNGVAKDRMSAHLFVADNGHFRMSVQDCAIIQGFPESWRFSGAVYVTLGQIGNAVAPPMAYAVGKAVDAALT